MTKPEVHPASPSHLKTALIHIEERVMNRLNWTNLCLIVVIAIGFPLAASADIVSGRIFGLDEKPMVNSTFTAKNAKGEATTFKTDKSGNFSVYLDPGKFTITTSSDATVSGVVESFPQPRQADVHLKKTSGK
jgi:hypothetical protein